MIRSKGIILIALFALSAGAFGEVSQKEAIKIGKKNLGDLMRQSHHFQAEYDTVIALPVHSRVVWKDDYYLLYFLKSDRFQVEMEVSRKNGRPTVLAVGHMSEPYYQRSDSTFSFRFFSVDSARAQAFQRNRLQPDSVRLVYFGVIPKLGKRGVAWETFSTEGVGYISLGGPSITPQEMVSEINKNQRAPGNYAADSIRVREAADEIKRLSSLSAAQREQLALTPAKFDSLIQNQKDRMEDVYKHFPELRQQLKLDSLAVQPGQPKP